MNYKKMLEGQPQDKVALIEDGQDITYGQLLGLAGKMEEKIRHNAGMRKEVFYRDFEEADRIQTGKILYFIEENTILEELAAFIACQGSNMVPVILTKDLPPEEREKWKNIDIPKKAVMGVLTSGTTGQHKMLFRTYESWADFFLCQNRVFSMKEDTVLFAQGSLAFTGNLNLYMALFSIGGTVVAEKRFDPRKWFSLIKKYRVNYIYLIPAKMMALCKIMKEPCKSVKHFVTGSQSFGKNELQRTKTCFPESSVVLYYGSSEANYITYLRDWEMNGDNRLVGRPFPGVEVRIQNGVFYVESAYGVIGIGHPFCTKDLGRADEEGRFYFEGRQDDLLNINGKKYSAYKIEQAIQEKCGVDSIVMVKRERDKDILTACYESDVPFPSVLNVRKQLREILPEQEIPKRFIHVNRFPRTDSGKIRRK